MLGRKNGTDKKIPSAGAIDYRFKIVYDMFMTDQTLSTTPQAGMFSQRISRLVAPPRWVPLPTACAALTGLIGFVGAIFFSFGMLFMWVFGAALHPLDEWRLSRSYAEAPAIIESVKPTNANVNRTPVYEYRFHFQPGDGEPVNGTCYTTGQTWQDGDRVAAHYLPENPEVARLEGSRRSMFSPWIILFLLIFPTVGLAFFVPPIVSGVKKIKLLRSGEITGATSISSSPTNTSINNVPVMKYSYEFRDRLGAIYTGASKALPTEKIGDEAAEPILYLPSNPQQSMLVDALPLKLPLEVDEEGHWRHRGSIKPVLLFLLAWSLVLVHVAVAIIVLF